MSEVSSFCQMKVTGTFVTINMTSVINEQQVLCAVLSRHKELRSDNVYSKFLLCVNASCVYCIVKAGEYVTWDFLQSNWYAG